MKPFALFFYVFSVPLFAQAAPSALSQRPESLVYFSSSEDQASIQKRFGNNWRVVETDHFRVFSDCSPRYQKIVSGILEQFYQEIYPRFFSRPFPCTDVYISRTRGEYLSLLLPDTPWAISTLGMYDPSKNALFFYRFSDQGSKNGLSVLFHEAIHAFVQAESSGKHVPDWFNEGFASLFEYGRILRGHWIYADSNPTRAWPLFEETPLIELTHYLHSTDKDFENGYLAYSIGHSLFFYLFDRGGEPLLKKILRAVLSGQDGQQAILEATGGTLAEINDEWRKHIQQKERGGYFLEQAISSFYGMPDMTFPDIGQDTLNLLKKGVLSFPDDGMLHLALAQEEMMMDQKNDALAQAKMALKDPRMCSPESAYVVLTLAYWDSDPSKAMAACQDIIDHQPWYPYVAKESFRWLSIFKQRHNAGAEAKKLLQERKTMIQEDIDP